MAQPPHSSLAEPATSANAQPDALADSLGVVRHLTETYSVGGYRYTTLTDAIAQARRMAATNAVAKPGDLAA